MILSLVIPCSGRVDLLEKTVRSIIDNRIEKKFDSLVEVILTDDSPNEDDRVRIKSLCDSIAKNSQIKARYIFSKEKLYQSRNTNQGIESSSGNYIRLFHSDDILSKYAIQRDLDIITKLNPTLVHYDAVPFEDDLDLIFSDNLDTSLPIPQHANVFLSNINVCTALPSGLLFSRSLFESLGGMREDYDFLCDWEMYFRFLIYCKNKNLLIHHHCAGFWGWRVHSNNVSSRSYIKHYDEHLHFIESVTTNLLSVFLEPEQYVKFLLDADKYRLRRLVVDWMDKDVSVKSRDFIDVLKRVLMGRFFVSRSKYLLAFAIKRLRR